MQISKFAEYISFSLLLLLCTGLVSGQKRQVKFQHLTVNDNLSHNTVHAIHQDHKGFLWFGTEDGLNRYDGYNFAIYRYDVDDSTAVSDIFINTIFEDSRNNLWIGTNKGGLNLYNREMDNFIHFKADGKDGSLKGNNIRQIYEDNNNRLWIATNGAGLALFDYETQTFKTTGMPDGLPHNDVRCLLQDSTGNLWIGTNLGGLTEYNPETGQFLHYYQAGPNPDQLPDNEITALLEDSDGDFWVGTRNGLTLLDRKTGKFTRFVNQNNPGDISYNTITEIVEDSFGQLWIGTGKGLNIYHKSENYFEKFYSEQFNAYTLSQNYILSMFVDKTDILWIGTTEGGINKYDKRAVKFKHIEYEHGTDNSISFNTIRSLHEDQDTLLWIGTLGEGLDKYDYKTGNFEHYKAGSAAGSLSNNKISAILKDSKQRLWVGTWEGGLNLMENENSGNFIHFRSHLAQNNAISSDAIQVILEDQNGRIWVGTEFGLDLFDESTQTFIHHIHKPDNANSISSNSVQSKALVDDQAGNLWIGTWDGLNKLTVIENIDGNLNKQFTRYYHDENNSNSLSDNRIISLHIDKKGNIWCGTFGGGLNKLIRTKDETRREKINFKRYSTKDGLANGVVYGIEEDPEGNIWLSTNQGLSKFDPIKEEFKNYDVSDGLQSNVFFWGASETSKTGRLIFGGINGINMFSVDDVRDNPYKPDIQITSFKLFNKEVEIGEDSPLKKNIGQTKELELSYRNTMISFEFAALHFSYPEDNKYRYMLEGFDKEWISTDAGRRFATYTNLDPNDYIFRIQAANCDGVWNEEGVSLKITVKPPVWQTWWFQLLVALFIFATIYSAYKYRVQAIENQRNELDRLVKVRTREVEEQKQHLQKANTELEKLSIVVRETDNAIMILDKNGNFEWVNASFSKLFGYELDEFKNEKSINLITNKTPDYIKKAVERAITDKQSQSYEMQTHTRDGKPLWIQATLTPILDKQTQEVTKLIAVDSDITLIKQAEEQILKQKNELEAKNQKIEFQNNHIRGSIRYAKTIQEAILPTPDSMNSWFDNFVLFRPKDIVSGDFYWISKELECNEAKQSVMLAAIDCTGHGVPGAFMSMIGNRLLNEIVNEGNICDPAQVLKTLNNKVITALKQGQSQNDDGMDVCLCRFDQMKTGEMKLTFAGAKRPLMIGRKDSPEIEIIKGTRKSVGGKRVMKNSLEYENNLLHVDKGDMVYLTTDGYIDQHSQNRKRFGTSRLLEILSAIKQKPLEEQQLALEIALDKYQISEEQRDDITILGVKI